MVDTYCELTSHRQTDRRPGSRQCRHMALERSTMLALLLISLGLLQTALAAEYVVGDATGWTYDETLKFYNDWAASKTLKVGDSLSKSPYFFSCTAH